MMSISPAPGQGVLPEGTTWQVYDGCPAIRVANAITSVGAGLTSATLDPRGSTGGPFAALVTVDDPVLMNRTAVMPFDLGAVTGYGDAFDKDSTVFSPGAYLLNYLVFWLGSDAASASDDLPGNGQVAVRAHPSPFNPATTLAFELPRALDEIRRAGCRVAHLDVSRPGLTEGFMHLTGRDLRE